MCVSVCVCVFMFVCTGVCLCLCVRVHVCKFLRMHIKHIYLGVLLRAHICVSRFSVHLLRVNTVPLLNSVADTSNQSHWCPHRRSPTGGAVLWLDACGCEWVFFSSRCWTVHHSVSINVRCLTGPYTTVKHLVNK